MSDQGVGMAIYVLPTEQGKPPQAVIGAPMGEGETIMGVVSIWSADMGSWTVEGIPVPEDLSDAITEHAKSLGVEW